MDLKYLYISVMAVFMVPSSAIEANIAINGNSEIGGNVTITCSWTLSHNEDFLSVQVRSFPVPSGSEYPYYYQFHNGNSRVSIGDQSNVRMSADNFDVNNNRVVVRITNVQCADEGNYSCYFTTIIPNQRNPIRQRFSYLTVPARPKLPVIRWTPNTSTDILESSNISVVCISNVGRSGHGSLQWKIYRRGVLEVIPPTDSRLSEMNNVSLAGEDSCTQRVQQTFNMPVRRADQNLTIACFVQNDDFQNHTPDMCLDPAGDICSQTQSFKIVYGVNETSMNVDSVPPGSVYQDKTLTLTCQATGLPAPVYTWLQVLDNSTDPGNKTFPGQSVGDGNQLVLSDLVISEGQELKYTCTASNTALGKLYSVTKEISVRVLMTTTTAKTTSTTTTPTTPTTSKGSQSVNRTLEQTGNKADPTKTIIIVVVVVGSILIIALIVGIILWRRRRSKKEIEEPSENPHNNRTNLSYQHSQADLVADKEFTIPGLDNFFTEIIDDRLMFTRLTYENKPRSRKPMVIYDKFSESADVHIPQV